MFWIMSFGNPLEWQHISFERNVVLGFCWCCLSIIYVHVSFMYACMYHLCTLVSFTGMYTCMYHLCTHVQLYTWLLTGDHEFLCKNVASKFIWFISSLIFFTLSFMLKMKVIHLFPCGLRNIWCMQGLYHTCWCPGSWCRQGIKSWYCLRKMNWVFFTQLAEPKTFILLKSISI